MSDEDETSYPVKDSGHANDPAAVGLALNAASPEARDYLRKQSILADKQARLADLQIDTLQKQDEFEISHLRWRRFSDQMRGAGQIMLVAVGLVFVIAIAAAFWSAAHDDGMVIEAFHVPPDMEQRGLDGDVVSRLLLDRLTFLQSSVSSLRAPSSYSGASGADIKVLIPDTGISISEAYRYLAGWLGHQTHISGEVYRTAKGIALVVRVGGNPGVSFEGSDSQLNALTVKAAESIFGQTQPYRYAVFLSGHARPAEADMVLKNLALNGPASEKPWAYALWMYYAPDVATAISRAQKAIALAPYNILAQSNASQAEEFAAHDEQALAYARATAAAVSDEHRKDVREDSIPALIATTNVSIAEELGDWASAVAIYQQMLQEPDFNNSHASSVYMMAAAAAQRHDVEASRSMMENRTDMDMLHVPTVGQGWNATRFDFPQFQQFVALGDWPSARKDIFRAASTPDAAAVQNQNVLHTVAWPLMALSEARTGDIASAWTWIGKTPLDCYLCLRVRGDIAATQKNWRGASYWFTQAAALAPSIPFAYADWGAMLMGKGDLDGAIAKFTIASQKGQHFADPLEMWGEALIAKNRSDLSLAKFEEAGKYAPRWGRLHLKWAEALLWSGDKLDAAKQLAIASTLDLTQSEKIELERMKNIHG
jgi:hypothetical protein